MPPPSCSKDSSVSGHIERMRLSAARCFWSAANSIIVATVSSIYGLGDPAAYLQMVLHLKRGDILDQRALLRRLAEDASTRATTWTSLRAATGCAVMSSTSFPAESERDAIRVQLFDETIEQLSRFDPLTGEVLAKMPRYTVYPGTHYVTPRDRLVRLTGPDQGRPAPAPRRSCYEQQQAGGGAAPAAAHHLRPGDDPGDRLLPGHRKLLALSLRPPAGRAAACLYDYLPSDALLVVDESHQTIPQLGAMYKGDRSRKETLVGIRLPLAVGAGQPPAEIRGMGIDRAADDFRVRHSGQVRKPPRRGRWWNRWCGPRASSTRWSRSARCARRSTTCCRRSMPARPAVSARW